MRRRELKSVSKFRTPPSENDESASSYFKKAVCTAGFNQRLLVLLVVFRTLNALLSFSAFVPDEYWQTLEVAHRMVFGYGHLTWEWHKPIRGFTHPLMYAALYKVMAILKLDFPILLIVLPRVLHVPIAVVGDYFVMKLASHLFGREAGLYALLANVASWFTFYCVTRTLSNSIETCLTPVVLLYWVLACEANTKTRILKYTRLYLIVIGISVLVRPTGVIMWPPIVLAHFIIHKDHIFIILRETIAMGSLTFIWSIGLDYVFYGKLVIVQWNFLKFNVLEGYSALYGAYSWHWYFTEDVPVLLFTSLPMVIVGVWLVEGGWWKRGSFLLALWELIVHSCLSHKEHRYVLPIVPIASLYAGYGIWWIINNFKAKAMHFILCGLLVANIPMALYFSLVHQRGTVAVMQYLRNDIDENSSVLFLMPCHTTPLYSHIHKPVPLRFLECPPPIRPDYKDISKDFYSEPEDWLLREYSSFEDAPTHLVLFNVLLPEVENFIKEYNYRKVSYMHYFNLLFQQILIQSDHIYVLPLFYLPTGTSIILNLLPTTSNGKLNVLASSLVILQH